MKRDMDLVREILMEIEKNQEGIGCLPLEIAEHTEREISYHIKLLAQANLIEALDASSNDLCWLAGALTWEGHEFLEAARDKSRWDTTKKMLLEKGGGLGYEVLKQLLVQGAKTAIGL